MKLRLKDNTIRIRLSMDEVNTLMEEENISSLTSFPGQQSLSTHLNLGTQDGVGVTFRDNVLHLALPKEKMKDWHRNDQVGHCWLIDLDQGGHLEITLEKDFKCLTDRPGEDESALYPNPNQSHG